MAEETRIDRTRGCLVGGAAGDALGYPVEFDSYEMICQEHGPEGIVSYDLDAWTGTALFSDDTQMTLFTAAGLVAAGKDAGRAEMAKSIYLAYLDWLHTQDRSFDQNPGTSWLLNEPQLFARRAPGNTCLSSLWSGRMGSLERPINASCGCGGVMRVAPVGLFVEDPDEAALVAAEAAAITHGHPMGYIPAACLAYIVNRCVFGTGDTLQDLVEGCIDRLPVWFAGQPAAAAGMVDELYYARELAAGDAPDCENIPLLGAGWVGDEALAIAVYACLRHPDDFSAAIVSAVNHSGDADSTGAIAGNIVGARLGLSAIGSQWTEDLELCSLIEDSANRLLG